MIAAFGLALMALGLASNLPVAVVVTMGIACCAVASDVLTQSMMQLAVPGALRGRAMGAWQVAVGFSPIGHLEMGLLAGAVGTAVGAAVQRRGAWCWSRPGPVRRPGGCGGCDRATRRHYRAGRSGLSLDSLKVAHESAAGEPLRLPVPITGVVPRFDPGTVMSR